LINGEEYLKSPQLFQFWRIYFINFSGPQKYRHGIKDYQLMMIQMKGRFYRQQRMI